MFLLFFAVGALLRLEFILIQGLSHDELSAWNRLVSGDFQDIVYSGVIPDMHPAFMQVLLQYWTNLFGTSELALRLPGTIFGLGAIVLIYHLGIKFFNKNVALLAGVLLLLPCLPIIHSTLARPYAPGLLFIVLLVFGIFRLEDSRVSKSFFTSMLCIILGATGSLYTHYFAGLAAGLIGIASLFYVNRSRWIYLISAGLVALLLFVPHWEITKIHLSRDGLGWLGTPQWFWFWDFLKLYFGDNYWFAGAFLILIPSGLIYAKFKADNKSRFLLLSFSGIYAIAHLISVAYTPILREPGVFMIMPLLLLGIGSFFQWLQPKLFNVGISVMAAFILGNTLFTAQLFENVHFEPFREITQLIKKYDDAIGSDEMLKLCNVTNINYLNYYAKKNRAKLNFERTLIEEVDQIHELARIINQSNKSYVMLARTNRAQNVIQLEIIRNKFPTQVVNHQFFNANFNIWTRGKFNERRFIKKFNLQNRPEWFKSWDSDTTKNEFIGDLRIPVRVLRADSSYILVKTKGWLDEHAETLNFVVVAERNGQLIQYRNTPVLYQAWDQLQISNERGSRDLFTAVEIPNNLKDADELHIYFWNRNFARVKIEKPEIYVVPLVD